MPLLPACTMCYVRLLTLWLCISTGSAQFTDQTAGTSQGFKTEQACHVLAATFRRRVLFPGDQRYDVSQKSYWSAQQEELKPACRFYPRNARDVQEALADTIIPLNVTIAVSSGGHSSNTGASNIKDGITLDLSQMNEVNLVPLAAEIGPGARWQDVYKILEQKHGLTTPLGGRIGNVAVGGYTLGGGFSWFANQYGWACDSVLKFQVVTPNAEVIWVDSERNKDLFWALKGSLGAFGIVTKLEVKVLGNAQVYGGTLAYKAADFTSLCDALHKLGYEAPGDLASQGYLTFAWVEAQKQFLYTAYLMNTEGKANSKSFIAFEAIPHVEGRLRTMNISESAVEIGESNPSGLRRSKFTYTSKLEKTSLSAIHDIVTRFTKGLRFDADGVLGVTFQPLTVPHLQASQNTGGNIFSSFSSANEPLVLISVEISWSDTTKDEYFDKAVQLLKREIRMKLTELGTYNDWVYPNYASTHQNPFERLTPQTSKMLKDIKAKYDPEDRWRTMVPGVWHV